MQQLFVSYAREDRTRAEPIVDELRRAGFQVFWDQSLPAGVIWRDFLDAQLGAAHRLVVLWSKASVASRWVRDEADEALQRGKLLPVLLDDVRPPLGFREVHCFDLIGWQGESGDPRLARLAAELQGSDAGSADAQEAGSPTPAVPAVPAAPPQPTPPGWRKPLLISAAALALLWLAFNGLQHRDDDVSAGGRPPYKTATVPPDTPPPVAVQTEPGSPMPTAAQRRCTAIKEQVSLGNPITESDRAFLKAGCR